jgi:transcriptional antiterminator NusG
MTSETTDADETLTDGELEELDAAVEEEEEMKEEKATEAARAKIPLVGAVEPKRDPFVIRQEKVQSMPVVATSVEAARQALPTIKGAREVVEEEPEEVKEEKPEEEIPEEAKNAHIYALRTTANREEQVMAFVSSNASRKKLGVYSVIAPHGMRGYIFVEAADRHEAEQAAFGVPYAKGLLPNEIQYPEIEHMLEQVKKEINIQKNDIAEILSGPFKREKCKIARVDKAKEEVVVELLEAAVPIPITLKIDAVKVIRRDEKEK